MKQEILKQCTVEGFIVKLPEIYLDRKLYLEVSGALELIGGKWKRKLKGFEFQENPTELLEQIAGGVVRNLKKEYQYFATPDKLADGLITLAEVDTELDYLEPSAGQGAIVKALNRVLPGERVDCYEAMPTNQTILQRIETVCFMGEDFLSPAGKKLYDRIIANPPFSKNQDIDHVEKMWSLLRQGGRIVSIMSNHWRFAGNKKETSFRGWIETVGATVLDIERGQFSESGTEVGGCIVVIDRA